MILSTRSFVQKPRWQTLTSNEQQSLNGQVDGGFALKWASPVAIVTTVLMVFGADVVRAALAQTTGKAYSPVCFSFGWVGYALSCWLDVFGDGRLLPPPDHQIKVFNLTSGYHRTNRNWVIGRIARDHELWIRSREPLNDNAIRIAVYEAETNSNGSTSFSWNSLHTSGVCVMILQMIIAAIPTVLTRGQEWGVLVVTGAGTILAMIMGCLPQWTAEKLPPKQTSTNNYALTAGNGSRDIMIIKGGGRCLNLEHLATVDSPWNRRLWARFDSPSSSRRSKLIMGIPGGFVFTIVWVVVQVALWLCLLVFLADLRDRNWYLLLNAAIGFVHNSSLATLKQDPRHRNLPLTLLDAISTRKTMDGLMDLEITHPDCGAETLAHEYFPGKWRDEEYEWWNTAGDRSKTRYDQQRFKESAKRLCPRSMIPRYDLHTVAEPDIKGKTPMIATGGNSRSQHRADGGASDGNTGEPTQFTSHPRPGADSSIERHANEELDDRSDTTSQSIGASENSSRPGTPYSFATPDTGLETAKFTASLSLRPDWD
ncbi:hypothetical protein F4818DRAFT_12174 [Hypoxylon cercidicola]|nr:hypothetical protein F4818DRAFT_12174 [Hypoxylon cercidicola]